MNSTAAVWMTTPHEVVEDFAAVDRHFLRGLDPEANLVPADFHHNDGNVIIDDNTLVLLAR